MKRIGLFSMLVLVVMLLVSVLWISPSQASGTSPNSPGGFGPGKDSRDGYVHDYVVKTMAEALGMTVADLQARLDKGERMMDIALSKGWTVDNARQKMTEVMSKSIDLALADGKITQDQAKWMKERSGKMGGNSNRREGMGSGWKNGQEGPLHEEMVSAMAGVLGLSSADLDARLEKGERMGDIAREKGLSLDTFKTKMTEAMTQAIKQALAKGLITQTQADAMLQKMERGGKGFGSGGNCFPSGTPTPNGTSG